MYKLNLEGNILEKITQTTFKENDIMERNNIEEWIRKDPSILGEELLIIAHEYDKFEVNERLDLLGLDKEGNLVIIEVKRDKTGGNVDFQALKYCSYCSTLTPSEVIQIYDEYLKKFNINENALENVMDFLEVDIEDLLNGILNASQRIIIIGREIDKRILSVSAWLSQNSIDIKCISIAPYILEESGDILIDVNQLIPTYSINDYFINKKKIEQSKGMLVQTDEVIEFFNSIVSIMRLKGHKPYYNSRKPYMKVYSEVNGKLVFGLVYRKKGNIFRLELSARDGGTSKILENIYNENRVMIEKELGYACELREGIKNAEWLRVFYNIEIDKKANLQDYIDEIGAEFVKFVEVLKSYFSTK